VSVTRDQLVAELARLGAELERGTPVAAVGLRQLAAATCFSTRRVTRFGDITPDVWLLAAVLEGHKDVVQGPRRQILGPGDVLVVGPGVGYRSTTVPDRRSGRYRVLVVQVAPELGAALARSHRELCLPDGLGAFDRRAPHVLAADVVGLQALVHYGATLLAPGTHDTVLRHRLSDLLLCLSLQQAAARAPSSPLRPPLPGDLVLAARALIRSDPAEPWPAPLVARRLGVSPATLRRRLASAGVSLRSLRGEERMALAAVLLAEPGARVGDVAARCGYQSPSKFARQYRQWFGRAPARRRVADAA
jgi:AraC-like DNA-binding protein